MNRLASAALSAAIGGALVVGTATESQAATTIRARALDTAIAQAGDPYSYGAAGPNAFDCSGLTFYSFKKHGKVLPRTAQSQYNKATKISAGNRTKGDLVFIGNSAGSIYHVGIYAGFSGGYGWMWDAPKPGRTVGKHKIKNYTGGSPRAYYGRFNG